MRPPEAVEPTVPVSYVLLILQLANEKGLSTDDILAQAHIPKEHLDRPEARFSLINGYAVICRYVMDRCKSPGLGYEFGLRSTITTHGILGYGLMSQSTLREVISFGSRYGTRLRMPAWDIQILEEGEHVVDIVRPEGDDFKRWRVAAPLAQTLREDQAGVGQTQNVAEFGVGRDSNGGLHFQSRLHVIHSRRQLVKAGVAVDLVGHGVEVAVFLRRVGRCDAAGRHHPDAHTLLAAGVDVARQLDGHGRVGSMQAAAVLVVQAGFAAHKNFPQRPFMRFF